MSIHEIGSQVLRIFFEISKSHVWTKMDFKKIHKGQGGLSEKIGTWLEPPCPFGKNPRPGNGHSSQGHAVTSGLFDQGPAIFTGEHVPVTQNRDGNRIFDPGYIFPFRGT
jgi:hypothetical protein